jgi:hypothetical protein
MLKRSSIGLMRRHWSSISKISFKQRLFAPGWLRNYPEACEGVGHTPTPIGWPAAIRRGGPVASISFFAPLKGKHLTKVYLTQTE